MVLTPSPPPNGPFSYLLSHIILNEKFRFLFQNTILLFTDYDKTGTDELPSLLCVITGKGPLQGHYLHEISKVQWNKVKIITPWLQADDYPRLLGS